MSTKQRFRLARPILKAFGDRRMPRFLKKLYYTSLYTVVEKLRSLVRHASTATPPSIEEPPAITKEFLYSEEYRKLMCRNLPCDGSYDLHEAQNETANFRFRHHQAQAKLGAFRWRGMQRNRDLIVDLVAHPEKKVIDFGGAACPLGFGSRVVDLMARDSRGNLVPYRSLEESDDKVDVLFSSHTLEHVPDLEDTLRQMTEKLNDGGTLILHLPSFYCERWRAGTHKNLAHHNHVWTFVLGGGAQVSQSSENYVHIDTLVNRFLSVTKAEYCGDDSILIIAEKSAAPAKPVL